MYICKYVCTKLHVRTYVGSVYIHMEDWGIVLFHIKNWNKILLCKHSYVTLLDVCS